MKITPLEIRQKTFEKKLRGYDKDEVHAFLLSLSQEWERLNDEKKEYKIKLTTSEREASKLREVENSLFKTLKTAEDTSANMIEQTNRTAELHMRETQMTADSLLNEAKTRARNMMEEAESESRRMVDEMERQIYELHQIFKDIQNQKDSMIADIRHLSKDGLERVEKLDAKSKTLNVEAQINRLNRLSSESEAPKAPERPKDPKPKARPKEQQPEDTLDKERIEVQSEEAPVKKQVKKSSAPSEETSSFFDEIE